MSNISIPFVDLSRQFRSLETELLEAFIEVGRSGVYILGDKLDSFEEKVSKYCGVKHALGVANGSDALFLILKSLGIGPGDEVITAANSFIATAWVIVAVGARPILVDVASDLNISPSKVAEAITDRTKAIIPVHLTGRPAEMDEINEIALQKGLYVIEDAAQAIGARYRNRSVGSLGTAGGFSLHPLKNLGVLGDGGFVTTNDTKVFEKLKLLRNHGLVNRDECEIWGYNSRLDSLNAYFAEIKLRKLDQWNERCREIAELYRAGIQEYVDVPKDQQYAECVYHNYVIRTEKRDLLMQYLNGKGISTKIHYPIPIHLQKAASNLGYKEGDFPNTELYAKTMMSLPIYPELSNEEVDYVILNIINFFRGIN